MAKYNVKKFENTNTMTTTLTTSCKKRDTSVSNNTNDNETAPVTIEIGSLDDVEIDLSQETATDSADGNNETPQPCHIKAYYDGEELTVPYSEYKCKKHAVEYIHNLYINRVVPYETLFMIYYGKHVETITIEIVLDTPDLLQCNTGYVNEGLKRDSYKIVCEGLKRLCSLIDDSHKCIVSLVTANNTHDFVIFKSKFEGLWTFYSEYKATMQTPETFARWLYHNTFTHKIVLKYWHTIKEGDTK